MTTPANPADQLHAAAEHVRHDPDVLGRPGVAAAVAYLLALFADVFADIPAVHDFQTRPEQAIVSLARAINGEATNG